MGMSDRRPLSDPRPRAMKPRNRFQAREADTQRACQETDATAAPAVKPGRETKAKRRRSGPAGRTKREARQAAPPARPPGAAPGAQAGAGRGSVRCGLGPGPRGLLGAALGTDRPPGRPRPRPYRPAVRVAGLAYRPPGRVRPADRSVGERPVGRGTPTRALSPNRTVGNQPTAR
jgi:hypothetical protein